MTRVLRTTQRATGLAANSGRLWTAPICGDLDMIEGFHTREVFVPHFHETFLLGVTLAGVEQFRTGGCTERSPTGRVRLINPGDVHSCGAAPGHSWRYCAIYPSASHLQTCLSESTGIGAIRFSEPVVKDDDLALQIARLYESICRAACRLESEERFLTVLQLAVSRHARIGGGCGGMEKPGGGALRRARDYIEANAARDLSLTELSRAVALSPHHLSRAFRQCWGLSPFRYLAQVRVARAKRLLQAGAPATVAAIESGFCDQSHMIRAFRGYLGVTPSRLGRNALPGA